MTELREISRKIAEDLASLLRKYFGLDEYGKIIGTGVSGDQSRYIDIVAEEYVVNEVKKRDLPAWVISEERGQWILHREPEYFILVDPLDGSLNYALRIPFASVSIAIYRKAKSIIEPEYGVVLDIFTGDTIEIYGKEVVFNGIHVPHYLNRGLEVLSVYTEDARHIDMLVKSLKESGIHAKTRTMGSASLEATYAALGLIGHFVHLTGKIRNTDLAVALAAASKLGAGIYIKPSLNEIRVDKVQSIEKVIIASKNSPLWRIVDGL